MHSAIVLILTLAAAASAAAHLYGEYGQRRLLTYIFKPLATICILAIALFVPGVCFDSYRVLIGAGLAFSVVGDIFLMLPSDRFVPGLASFLIAHLAYIAAFLPPTDHALPVLPLALFLALGAGMFCYLRPNLGNLAVPVAVYVGVICIMVWLACARWLAGMGPLAFAGALLFLASDAMLAVDRFRQPFRSARFLVMTSYYLAQWLIALSVAGHAFS